MSRPLILMSLLVAFLAGALIVPNIAGTGTLNIDESQVRAIVSEMLTAEAENDATADMGPQIAPAPLQLTPETINPMIEAYLLEDPRILQRVSEALQDELRREEIETTRVSLQALEDQIYNDPDHVVLGNPDGDVTLVEFFDYNCGYCRSSMPDLARLLESDPNLRVILKEFPILSNESLDAALIAVAISQSPETDYWDFHQTMFNGRGQATRTSALAAAASMGLDEANLIELAESEEALAIVQRNYAIAQALSITGTPTYIIGDEILPGAVGFDELEQRIANMRSCGATICDDLS